MGTPSTGARASLALDTALPFDTSSLPLEFESCSIGKQGTILDTQGIRGTRQYHNSRTRLGTYAVAGQLVLPMSPLALDYFLPMILGGSEVTDVFDLAETLQSFYLMLDSGAKVTTWAGCHVARCTIRASQGQIATMTLDIEGMTETVAAAGGFPVLTMPTDSPYVMSDAVLTLQTSAREVSEIELVIDNKLETGRFQNSRTRAAFPSSGVEVSLNTNHPWSSSETDLYDQAIYGAAGSLVFTNADVAATSLTIALGFLQAPAVHPQVSGRGETRLPLQMIARKSGSTPAIRFTNVHA
jgi:hypothetical protein